MPAQIILNKEEKIVYKYLSNNMKDIVSNKDILNIIVNK